MPAPGAAQVSPNPAETGKSKGKTGDAPACGCKTVNGKKDQCRTHRREHRNKKAKKSKDKKKLVVAKTAESDKKKAVPLKQEDSDEEHEAVEGAITPDKICITGPAGVAVIISVECEGHKEAAPRATKDAIKEPTKGIIMLGPQDCPQFIQEEKIPMDNGKLIYNKYSAGTLVRNKNGEAVFYPDGGNKFDSKGAPLAIEGDGIDKQLQLKIGAEYRYAGVVDVNKSGLPEFRMLDEKYSAPQDKNALVGCLILFDGLVQFVATKGQAVGSGDHGAVVATTREGIVPAGTVLGEMVIDKKNGRISGVKKTGGQNVVATVVQGNYNQPIIVASKEGPLSVGTICAPKDAATYKELDWQKLVSLDEMTQKCSTNDITKSSLAALSAMLGCTSKQAEEMSVIAECDVNRGCLQYLKIAPEAVSNIANGTQNEKETDANATSSAGMTQKCSTGDASKATAPSAMLGCTSKYTEETSKKSELNRGAQLDLVILEGKSTIANTGEQSEAGEATRHDAASLKDDMGQKSSGRSVLNRGGHQDVKIAPEALSNIANRVQSEAGAAPEPGDGSSKDDMAQKCSTGDGTNSKAPSAMLGCTSRQDKAISNKSELNRGGQQDVKIAPEGISNIANVGVQSEAGGATKPGDGRSNAGMTQKCSTGDTSKATAPSAMLGCTSKYTEETSKKSELNRGAQQDVKIAPEGLYDVANVGVQSEAAPAVATEEASVAPQGVKTVLSAKSNSLLKSAATGSLKPLSAVQLKELKGESETAKLTLMEASGATEAASADHKEPISVAGGKTQQTMKYTVTSKSAGASVMGGASKVGGAAVSKQEVVSVACYEGGNGPNMSKYVTPSNKAAALNQTAKLAAKSTYIGNNAGEGRSQWLGGK